MLWFVYEYEVSLDDDTGIIWRDLAGGRGVIAANFVSTGKQRMALLLAVEGARIEQTTHINRLMAILFSDGFNVNSENTILCWRERGFGSPSLSQNLKVYSICRR